MLKTGILQKYYMLLNIKNSTKYLKTHTSFILNKYDIDVTYDIQVKKHKTV